MIKTGYNPMHNAKDVQKIGVNFAVIISYPSVILMVMVSFTRKCGKQI